MTSVAPGGMATCVGHGVPLGDGVPVPDGDAEAVADGDDDPVDVGVTMDAQTFTWSTASAL